MTTHATDSPPASPPSSTHEFWSRLALIDRVSIEAWSSSPSSSDETFIAGDADVRAERTGAGTIALHERGEWRAADGDAVRFHNRWAWSFDGGPPRVSRARGGGAVPLVELVRDGGRMVSVRAHECGEDRYDASLSLDGDALVLEWIVTGPRKRQRLRCAYHTQGTD